MKKSIVFLIIILIACIFHTERVQSQNLRGNQIITIEGKFKNKPSPLGDIICYIPVGKTVKIISKKENYYKVKYNRQVGYLSDLYFQKTSKKYPSEQKKHNQPSKKNNTSQPKECKTFYRDGTTFQYYIHNGVSVTMELSYKKSYGKYYEVAVAIENITGSSFDFDPNNISAKILKGDSYSYVSAISAYEYMKNVNKRQSWNAAIVSMGQYNAANQAGYSNSSSTSTTEGYTTTYGNASGYYGNTSFKIHDKSTTYGTATTNSYTQSYDGAAAYAAQQNANRNINNYQNQQYQIKQSLNQGYLKINTIPNGYRIIGYVNIPYKKGDSMTVTIPVDGTDYDFLWKCK
jgi:hypothetical protein